MMYLANNIHFVFNVCLFAYIALMLAKSASARSHVTGRYPSIDLLIRAYAGDRKKCSEYLIKSMQMFVDMSHYHPIFILDDESAADHAWGAVLERDYNFTVFYEEMPPENALSMKPYHEEKNGHYGSVGYNRQVYTQFFLDMYSKADIIGLLDCDNIFQTFLTNELVYDNDMRIKTSAVHHNNYGNEPIALKMPIPFGAMETEVMPKFYWRDTITECRNYLVKLHEAKDFPSAWKIFARKALSPVNIFAYYGMLTSPDKYVFIFETDSTGMISPGTNRPNRHDTSSAIGCCRSFKMHCSADFHAENAHVLRYENPNWPMWKATNVDAIVWNHFRVSFVNNSALVKKHYENVHKILNKMPDRQVKHMKDMCTQGILPLLKRQAARYYDSVIDNIIVKYVPEDVASNDSYLKSLILGLNGTVIKSPKDNGFYLICDGKRRWIPDMDTAKAMHLDISHESYTNVSPAFFDSLPDGGNLPRIPVW